jgi:nucleotide-binding universal stress UspA family protein
MFNKILVGYNGSPGSEDALRFGLALARICGGRVIAVCAHGIAMTSQINARTGQFVGTAADAKATLSLLQDRVGDAVSVCAPSGLSESDALQDLAADEEADLIVVGSTTRAAPLRTLPGTTGDQLLHGSPCAVAVVPHDFASRARLRRIGVAYAPDAEASAVLATAQGLARAADASLRVITAVEPRDGSDEVDPERRLAAERDLQQAVATLDGGLNVTQSVVSGYPVRVLRDQTAELDLLVMGSRGLGPIRRVFLGSVSHGVLMDSRCPVLVLPKSLAVESAAA